MVSQLIGSSDSEKEGSLLSQNLPEVISRNQQQTCRKRPTLKNATLVDSTPNIYDKKVSQGHWMSLKLDYLYKND